MDTAQIKDGMVQALNDFYSKYVVESANGAFQVFQSFTYGEMVISFLLASILVLMVLKWVFEVMH